MATTDDERYARAREKVEAKIGFFTHLAVFVAINVIFIIIAGEDWLWVTLFWGIGLAIHAFNTFFGDSDAMTKWKERQIQKELSRGEPKPAATETPAAPEPVSSDSAPAEPTVEEPGANDPTLT